MSPQPPLLPPPPVDLPPSAWPGMILYAGTVLLEAESEPDEGKLGVAWVIRRRMDQRGQTVHEVVLAPWQFSCWNSDASGIAKARLTSPESALWTRCWWAACAAYWRLLPDPTRGADCYLNPTLARASRRLHDLPGWYDPAKITVVLGRHEFLKVG